MRGVCASSNMRGVGASSNGAGAGSGSASSAVSSWSSDAEARGRSGTAAVSSAGASPPERRDERRAGGEDTRRDVGEETRRDVGEARARVARAPEGEVARASSSAMRRRLALASGGTGALATLRRRVDAARVVAAVARGSIDRRDARVARVSVVGVCRGGRSVGGIGEGRVSVVVVQNTRGSWDHERRGTHRGRRRRRRLGRRAGGPARRRPGGGRAHHRERRRGLARAREPECAADWPCPPTIARGGRNTRTSRSKGNDRLFLNHEVQIKPSFLGSIRKPAAWVFLGLWKYFSRKEKPPSLPGQRPFERATARSHPRGRKLSLQSPWVACTLPARV